MLRFTEGIGEMRYRRLSRHRLGTSAVDGD